MAATNARAQGGEAVPADRIEQVPAEFGGDPHAAIGALLSEVDRLEHELALTRPVVSRGFSRGWHHDRWAGGAQCSALSELNKA